MHRWPISIKPGIALYFYWYEIFRHIFRKWQENGWRNLICPRMRLNSIIGWKGSPCRRKKRSALNSWSRAPNCHKSLITNRIISSNASIHRPPLDANFISTSSLCPHRASILCRLSATYNQETSTESWKFRNTSWGACWLGNTLNIEVDDWVQNTCLYLKGENCNQFVDSTKAIIGAGEPNTLCVPRTRRTRKTELVFLSSTNDVKRRKEFLVFRRLSQDLRYAVHIN